ncbi:MAG: AfsR/SARP family transcriptional regulator [Bacteroidota bacterium]
MGCKGNSKLKLENIAYLDKMEMLDTVLPSYNHLAYNQNERRALDLAEHCFRRGAEVPQQIGNDLNFNILNRSLLALVYSKKGQLSKALTMGKEALHDALSQGGVIAPICEMLLSSIFLEIGDHQQAKERLENSAALLKELDQQELLEKGSGATLRNIKPLKYKNLKFKPEIACREKVDSYLFKIQMFGPIRVFHHEQEIDATCWRTVKSRDLLAYLAHQNRPVSTDQILEDLWPNVDPDKSSALFHTTLYYLRRLLQQFTDKEIIIRGSKRYQLRPGSILSGRYQFEEVAHLLLEKTMTATLANELETAILLYQGDYLEDLDYQWIVPVREELRNLYIELKQKLAVYYLQNKAYSRAVNHLRQLMELKPYSEEVLKLLLTTLAKLGDQSGVKKHYALFSRTISEELGLQPSSEIAHFYKELCDTNRS